MAWVSTRWLKLRQRGIAQFVSISIVVYVRSEQSVGEVVVGMDELIVLAR
jgi:hypothetical protein